MIKQILVSYIFSIGLSFCLGILVRITFIDADIFPQFLLNRFYLPLIPSGVIRTTSSCVAFMSSLFPALLLFTVFLVIIYLYYYVSCLCFFRNTRSGKSVTHAGNSANHTT